MCTLTVVPFGGGAQVCCNRDERWSRPLARPPRIHAAGEQLALFPTDPPTDGTWIGVNDLGLVAALLNRTMPGDRRAVDALRCTRGMVVRHALSADTIDHAIARVTALPLRAFEPFTVVLVHEGTVATIRYDGWDSAVTQDPLERPLCFTSSSLGDLQVLEPRLERFERLVGRAREPLLMQGAFHRDHWEDRPEISVHMRRADAATVSRTWITVAGERITMSYQPLTGESTDGAVITEIPCRSSPAFSSRPSLPRTSRLSAPVC